MFRSLCNSKDGKAPLLLNSHSDFEHPEISFRAYTFISQIRPIPVCEEHDAFQHGNKNPESYQAET